MGTYKIIQDARVDPNAVWGGKSGGVGNCLNAYATDICKITIEYDRKNEFLRSAQIVYNVARADNNLGLKSNELRDKLEQEFDDHHIFDVEKEDYSKEDLAVDKRENLNKLLEAEEGEDDEDEED